HVAMVGPAGCERQPGEAAALGAEPAEDARGNAGRQAIERRPPRDEGPEPDATARRGGAEMALELALAPVAHHLGQRDAHRAHALAAAAEGRRVGQRPGLADPE